MHIGINRPPTREGRRVRIGVMFANGGRSADAEHATALAVAAEDLGYESLWAVQHIVMPVDHASEYPYSESGTVPGGAAIAIPDPLVWLAWAGALTTRIRLATGVLVLPQQHPLVVAKQAATLDRLTGGRVILGVGAGWLREEFQALDAEFDDRGARLDQSIDVLRRAWSPGPTEFDGAQLRFPPVHVEPKPVSQIPIVIGGHSDPAARRAGRIADGFFPLACQGDRLIHLVDIVRAEARRAGRDGTAIEITVDAPRSPVEAAVQARLDIDRVVVNAPNVAAGSLRAALEARLFAVEEALGRA
jgi:probable F420-dependent oxidoreductase